jgi:hypothetical protein
MTWYKEMGHENYKKGLGFSALAPSFLRSRCVAVGSERPARGVLRFLGLLLLQKLPNAFVTFPNARTMPDVQGAPVAFHNDVYVRHFAASASTRTDHFSSINL